MNEIKYCETGSLNNSNDLKCTQIVENDQTKMDTTVSRKFPTVGLKSLLQDSDLLDHLLFKSSSNGSYESSPRTSSSSVNQDVNELTTSPKNMNMFKESTRGQTSNQKALSFQSDGESNSSALKTKELAGLSTSIDSKQSELADSISKNFSQASLVESNKEAGVVSLVNVVAKPNNVDSNVDDSFFSQFSLVEFDFGDDSKADFDLDLTEDEIIQLKLNKIANLESADAASYGNAYLGPNLWEKNQLFHSDEKLDYKVEHLNVDEFLKESGLNESDMEILDQFQKSDNNISQVNGLNKQKACGVSNQAYSLVDTSKSDSGQSNYMPAASCSKMSSLEMNKTSDYQVASSVMTPMSSMSMSCHNLGSAQQSGTSTFNNYTNEASNKNTLIANSSIQSEAMSKNLANSSELKQFEAAHVATSKNGFTCGINNYDKPNFANSGINNIISSASSSKQVTQSAQPWKRNFQNNQDVYQLDLSAIHSKGVNGFSKMPENNKSSPESQNSRYGSFYTPVSHETDTDDDDGSGNDDDVDDPNENEENKQIDFNDSNSSSVTMDSFTNDKLKKRRHQFVPNELKDEKYWDRRRKNNIAAKRSRDARRMKENQIALRAAYLERENDLLRRKLEESRREAKLAKMKLARFEASLNNY